MYGNSFHGWYYYAVRTRTPQSYCTEGNLFMTSGDVR
nr:MAG TPA: hypothetical protein [Caudoviricetes sp.]